MKKLYLNIYPLINVINQAGTNQMKARAINNRNILVLLSLVGGPSNKTKYLSPFRHSPDHRHDQYNEYKQGDTAALIIDRGSLVGLHYPSPRQVTRSHHHHHHHHHKHHHHHGHIIIIITLLTLVSPFHGSLVRAVSVGWRWHCPADSFTVPAAAPRGTDPPIKQLKLTRWQFLQDPTTLLSINL